MSKYTRSNKINHYHDSATMRAAHKQARASSNYSTKMASIILDKFGCQDSSFNGSSNSSSSSSSSSSCNSVSVSKCLEPRAGNSLVGRPAMKGNRKFSSRRINHDSSTLKQLAFFAFFIQASIIIILCLEIRGVSSLNCYHCSSVDNPECDEPFTGRANYTDTDCEKHIGRPAKVCRKIVQYIEDKKVVIRSCGFIDEHDGKDRGKAMCYKRSGTFAIMMESCNCYEDNCNHSASLVPSLISVSSCGLILMVVAFVYRHSEIQIDKKY